MTRQPNESELQQIKALLQAGQKEEATRIYREATQAGMFITQNAIKELEHTLDHLADIRLLIQQGEKILAIKRYRERMGVDLKEAKRAVDAMSDGSFTPGDTSTSPAPSSSPADARKIDQCIRRGEKVTAIKLYREQHRVGLKEAKEAVDARETLLLAGSAKRPQKHPTGAQSPGKQRAGWGIVFWMVLLLLGLIFCYALMRQG